MSEWRDVLSVKTGGAWLTTEAELVMRVLAGGQKKGQYRRLRLRCGQRLKQCRYMAGAELWSETQSAT